MGVAPLLGTPKNMLSKALGLASVSIWAPILGEHRGTFFDIIRYDIIYDICLTANG
jgi:hypothetical protein